MEYKIAQVEFPSYFKDEPSKERVRRALGHRFGELYDYMEREFGRVSVDQANLRGVLEILTDLTSDVAEEAISACAVASAKRQRESTANMVRGIFAGIKLGQKEGAES